MEPTERFSELIAQPESDVSLDETALVIAAHDHPVDIARELARIDDLANGAPVDAAALAAYLFGELGFTGNAAEYGDPRNSYLDEVVRRRLGLPITLSVLMIEVGRRAGLRLVGVGMPGHFLVGVEGTEAFFDPFHGGAALDADQCRELFAIVQPNAMFERQYLEPTGTHAIVSRMLANLVHTFMGLQMEASSAVWALRLRLQVPGLASTERRQAAQLLGTLGQFREAADALEQLAEHVDDDTAARDARDASALRARGN